MKLINSSRLTALAAIGSLALTACSPSDNFDQAYQSFDLEQIKSHIKTLSSDEFGGRAPATPGGKMTTDLLVKEFKALGLQPGNGDSFLQPVPLMSILSQPTSSLAIADIEFEYRNNFVANSRQTKNKVALDNSELVFVGYGINAPEYDWNDYAGLDVKGKTVVVLVNDPGYATQDPELFDGNTMTYYGRWVYKYEEAARQGAAGAIIIHETKPASYGWNVIESSWTGTQYHLPAEEVDAPAIDVEMWISLDKTLELFTKAGKDFNALKASASKSDFKPVPLGLTASISLENQFERSESNNVVATIPGSEAADEHVIYMGHWDHIGTIDVDGEKRIYNGAHDNASGTAGLIAIAKAYQQLNIKPKRSISFIAVTAEEQGRLGSRYFADHPTMPLNQITGLVNMDSLSITGKKQDVTVVGFGKSEMETYLEKAASRQGRTLVQEKTPERGYYYRSDHFSLALKGVPALSAGGGSIPLDEEQAAIAKRVGAQVGKCYHQECDEYSEDWGWDGVIAELQMYFETGHLLSNDGQWPNWREGTEFKAARDAMMKDK